jgi:hypothetical protein
MLGRKKKIKIEATFDEFAAGKRAASPLVPHPGEISATFCCLDKSECRRIRGIVVLTCSMIHSIFAA